MRTYNWYNWEVWMQLPVVLFHSLTLPSVPSASPLCRETEILWAVGPLQYLERFDWPSLGYNLESITLSRKWDVLMEQPNSHSWLEWWGNLLLSASVVSSRAHIVPISKGEWKDVCLTHCENFPLDSFSYELWKICNKRSTLFIALPFLHGGIP